MLLVSHQIDKTKEWWVGTVAHFITFLSGFVDRYFLGRIATLYDVRYSEFVAIFRPSAS